MTETKTDQSVYWRQLDIVAPDRLEKLDITFVGVGGLGSPTAFALAKMGVKNMTAYDFDEVEEHNEPSQIYTLKDIGKMKVEALAEMVENCGGNLTQITDAYKDQPLSGVVIVSADSMKARKDVWNACKYNPNVPLFIDMRMGAEEGRIFAMNPSMPADVKHYESMLFDDEDGVEMPCTAKAIIYNTFIVGAIVCNIVKKWVMDEPFPRDLMVDSITIEVHTILGPATAAPAAA